MPRYRFNLMSARAHVPDRDGTVLANASAAREEALFVASELVKPGQGRQQRKWNGWSIQVTDDQGGEVTRMPIGEWAAEVSRAAASADKVAAPVGSGAITDLISETQRLKAEATRNMERCLQLRRAVTAEIDLARKTAKLSSELLTNSRRLSTIEAAA